MPRPAIPIVAVLLVVAPIGIADDGHRSAGAHAEGDAEAPATLEPHSSIYIDREVGPTGFVLGHHPLTGEPIHNTAMGVRGGSGTAEDPYVISNWTIVSPRPHAVPHAISIAETDAHVVLEDLLIPEGNDGIHLEDAANVTIQDVDIWGTRSSAIRMVSAENVQVHRTTIGDPPGPAESILERGVDAIAGASIELANVSVHGSPRLATLSGTRDVAVENSTFADTDGGSVVTSNVQNASFVSSRFVATQVYMSGEQRDIRHAGNAYIGSGGPSGDRLGDVAFDVVIGTFRDIEICGSRFTGHADQTGFHFGDIEAFDFVGNRINGTEQGIRLDGKHVTVERNVVENTTAPDDSSGLMLNTDGTIEAHNNTIQNNAWGGVTVVTGEVNLTHNWWQDPAGPDVEGQGPGEEELLISHGAALHWDPPLQAPPEAGPEAVDCGVGDVEPGVEEGPDLGRG